MGLFPAVAVLPLAVEASLGLTWCGIDFTAIAKGILSFHAFYGTNSKLEEEWWWWWCSSKDAADSRMQGPGCESLGLDLGTLWQQHLTLLQDQYIQ
jgi:hypothetical protein